MPASGGCHKLSKYVGTGFVRVDGCRRRPILFLAATFVLSILVVHPHSTRAECVTEQCHTLMADQERIHPGELDCEECHVAMEEDSVTLHPTSGQASFVLKANEYCVECHEDLELQKYVHPPVAAGDCSACHSPHVEKDGHLRRKSQVKLCLTCHPEIITSSMTQLHGPIAQGVCISCHPPHAAPYEGLLAKEYPLEPFVSYNDQEYDLCFSCHSRELLLFPDTSFATGFRDGDRNLHYLHVNRKTRGRNCYLCHAIHGGTRTNLVSDNVPFGIWNLPLNYEKTENGGTCTPGCHSRFSYDRQKPPEPLENLYQ